MKMSIHVTNANLDKELFNQFCFTLQLARPNCERTDDGVLFFDIPADVPYHIPSHHPPNVSVETFFQWHIRNICERTASLFCWPPMMNGSYSLNIHYTDIQPSLFCGDMCTSMTEGYPICERTNCIKGDSCPYAPDHKGGDQSENHGKTTCISG